MRTGIDPGALSACDWAMLESLEQSARRQVWGQPEELLASIFDVLDALYVAFLQANSDPSHRHEIREAMTYPRPHEKTRKRSWLDLARALTGRKG